MALFGQDRPQIGGGFAALGAALGGNGEDAYQKQLLANYQTQRAKGDAGYAMDRASKERLSRIALEGLADTLGGIGFDPNSAGLLQAGGGNASQLVNALGGLDEIYSRRGATEAALGGDQVRANAYLTGVANGPVDLTKVAGGVAFNPLGLPDQDMQSTPLGDAEAAKLAAGADKERALAAKYAEQTRTGGGGGRARPVNYSIPSDKALGRVFVGKMDPELGYAPPDTAGAQEFLRWQAEKAQADPRFSDGDFALGQYMLERQKSAGLGASPAAAAAPTGLGAGPVDPLEPVFVDPAQSGNLPGPRTRADVQEQIRPVTTESEANELLAEANAAIQRGADPKKVRARLLAYGLTLQD